MTLETSPPQMAFFFTNLSFQTAAAVFLNGSACFSGLFSLSVEGLFWITINFQLMFMHSSWIQTAGFHWSTDLLTSTTLLWVMNYFDPMVTPTLKPSRLWSQAFCSLCNPCWKQTSSNRDALFTFENWRLYHYNSWAQHMLW